MGNYKNLWNSYFKLDHKEFLSILDKKLDLKKDPFGLQLIPHLKKAILQQFIVKVVKSYQSLKLEKLARTLSIELELVTYLFTDLINSGKITGYIDEIEGIFDNQNVNEIESSNLEVLGNFLSVINGSLEQSSEGDGYVMRR